MPPNLISVIVEISVAGQHHVHSFPPVANQRYTFEWDGKDGYGRPVLGGQTAWIRMINGYPTAYQVARDPNGRSWALSDALVRATPLTLTPATLVREFRVPIGAWDGRATGLGGWSLSAHHAYDPSAKVLYLGNGDRRREIDALGPVIDTVAGNGMSGTPLDGGIAAEQKLQLQFQIPMQAAPDGSVYFVNTAAGYKIFRWNPDGTITHIAGTSNGNNPRVGVPARDAWLGGVSAIALAADGSLFFADSSNHTIRRIRATDTVVEYVAGTPGVAGFGGDGGPALAAQLSQPRGLALGPDGSVYVEDYGNKRIRRIGPDGYITTIAGNGQRCGTMFSDPACQSGQPALTQAVAAGGSDTIVVGPDGSVYGTRGATIGTGSELFRVGADGILTVIAGKRDLPQSEAEGVAALNANMTLLQSFALNPDGSIWYTVLAGFNSKWQVRRIDMVTRTVRTIGGGAAGFGGDGGPALGANLAGAAALEFTPDGALFIVDSTNVRIRRLGARLPGFAGAGGYQIPAEDGGVVYEFDNSGRHLSTRHALTGATLLAFSYDEEGRLASITDGDGNVTTISRAGGGAPTAIIAPFGQRTALTTDANGYLTSVGNPADETYALAHGSNGLLTSMTMPKGQSTTFSYDPTTGYLLSDSDPAGGVQTLERTELSPSATLAAGHRNDITTALGRTRSNQTEARVTGERVETATGTDGLASVSTLFPDASETEISPTGTMQTIGRRGDPRWGMLAPVVSGDLKMPSGKTFGAGEAVTATLSDPTNLFSLTQLTQTFTVNGRTFTTGYDAATKQFTDTTAAGRIGTTTIDTQGRPVAVQFGGLAAAALIYDGFGRLTSLTLGFGDEARTTTLGYDAQSYLQSITDPLGRVTSFTHDLAAGR